MAHKKAAGSVKNLKDSQPKYRGVKGFGGQPVLAGNIIIRQKGSKYECGKNTYEAADFTVHAAIDGVVAFRKKNCKNFSGRTYLNTVVDVLTAEEAASKSNKLNSKKEDSEKVAVKKAVTKKEATPKAEKKAPAKKSPAKKVEKAE